MPSPTKQAIVTSFLRLIAKRPPDKITVRDIVDDCGVNRNTFYYYFQDIYAVLEDLCHDVIESLPTDGTITDTVTTLYARVLAFTVEHPAAARSLALSLGYEGLERYFYRDLAACLASVDLHASVHTTPLQRHLLCHAVLGLCLEAMRGGKTPPPTPEDLNATLTLTVAARE